MALLFEQNGLAAGADAVAVDLDDLDGHLLAEARHVLDLVHALDVELGDVDQGLHVGQHFDDGADLEDLADLGGVVLAEVGALVVVLEHFRGLGQRFGGGGEDGDLAGVVDVHGRAGGRGDGLDVLAAGADDEADDVGIDVDLGVLGRVLGEFCAGAGEDLGHFAEDVGEDYELVAFLDEAHGNAGHRGADRHARVH